MPILKFKDDINPFDLQELQPATWILWTNTVLYCKEWNLPLLITSIISDRKNVQSVSNSHEQGRAFDISTMGWTEQSIHRFCFIMNQNYRDIAAISKRDNVARAAIYHNSGNGYHIHLQVKPSANWQKFI